MSDIRSGINPLQVDPSTAPILPAGTECEDPRGGVFTGNTIKYAQATGTIAAGDAVRIDFAATAANRRFSVVSTTAVTNVFEGYALAAATANQFLWIVTKGFAGSVKVLNAGVAGSVLAASATAGTLTISPSAAVADAIIVAGGRRAFALTTPSGNIGDVLIGG